MHPCPICPYTSKRNYNLLRHVERIHNMTIQEYLAVRDAQRGQIVEQLGQNVEQLGQNVEQSVQNVERLGQNVEQLGQNVEFTCNLCQKMLSCKKSLARHRLICTEISNSLECKFCNRVFNNRSTKSKHIQKCKIETQTKIQEQYEKKTTMDVIQKNSTAMVPTQQPTTSTSISGNVVNTQSTIHTQNNNTQNNNTVIINAFGKEDMSHITPDFIAKCIRMANNTGIHDMVKQVHLNPEVPSNNNVRVLSNKQDLMEVFIDENRWRIQDKTYTLDNIIRSVCDKMMEHYQGNEEDIREEDKTQEYYYYRKLMEVANQNPMIRYYNLRKQVYASVLDFSKYRMTISIEPSSSESILPIPPSSEVSM